MPMTDWEDLTPGEKADELKERLEELESRVEMQGQMVVGEDKFREELDALKRVIGQLGFVDLDLDGEDDQ